MMVVGANYGAYIFSSHNSTFSSQDQNFGS